LVFNQYLRMVKRDRNRLRVMRAEKRITQIDAAAKAGIGVTRFWRIENGYTDPTPGERERIAKALRVSSSEVFPEPVAS
jgi:transcriptional regulator with XRE-family HTH domain